MDLSAWQGRFEQFIRTSMATDAAHDLSHIRRVVAMAGHLADAEGANEAVVLPAAWLHDCVVVPKTSPDRQRASAIAADQAVAWLAGADYPARWHAAIHHAIEAHSYSAAIEPRTLEAKVVQDADRLDAIGAVGMARCLMLGGQFGSALYSDQDPFCRTRSPQDKRFAVDHFFAKLLNLADSMQTDAGRRIAAHRTEYMQGFLSRLQAELSGRA